jgi:hypothetical protein
MSLGSQRERCVAVLDHICAYAMAKMFAQPVDPDRDNLPDYHSIVTQPMDLGTVRAKLLADEYPTVASWRDDMERIWSNSLAVHPRGSLISTITLEMQTIFRKASAHLSDSPEADWLSKLTSLKDELCATPRPPTMGPIKREKPPPLRPVAEVGTTPEKAKKKKKHQSSFTKAEIAKLAADINSLKDDLHVLSIFGVLERYEPKVNTDVDRLELDIAPLRTLTLNALRTKVDKCLGIQEK